MKPVGAGLGAGAFTTHTVLGAQPGANFPDGPGKDTVVAVCNGCHDINRVRAGYNAAGWNMLQHMMQNMGAPVAPEDWPTVTTYLTKNFPERPRPAAAIIPGPAQATIKLWDVPTIGSRPHDPLATKDGAIWWTGQLANKLGRIDPKTGAIREYSLKSPHTAPHGLTEDKRRQHLVHRQQRRPDRQARSQDRPHHRIPAARSERPKTRIR